MTPTWKTRTAARVLGGLATAVLMRGMLRLRHSSIAAQRDSARRDGHRLDPRWQPRHR